MDHLPLPDGVSEHILVPYLNGIPYDNEGFIDYDSRQGWDVQKLRQGNIRGARQEWTDYSETVLTSYEDLSVIEDSNMVELLVGPFIQNWILYGVFQTALKRPIAAEECIVEHINPQNGVRTRCLTSKTLFQEFARRKREFARDENWITSLSNCLKRCAWILEALDALSDELGSYVIPGPTHLALSSLVQTLDEYKAIWFQPGIPQMTASITHARWLEQDLKNRHWCLFRKSRVKAELGIGGLYYASILPNTSTERNDHTSCTESICFAFNVSENSEYVQHHQELFCKCKTEACLHDGPECLCKASCAEDDIVSRICQLVEQNQFPLISIDRSAGKLKFEVTPFREGIKYVAISHVWSDGMGNPFSNMIPSCQAEYLHSCASQVLGISNSTEPVFFWVDTLCVPLKPDSARWSAIQDMHRIYSNAAVVLVLTEELMTGDLPSSSDEILIRILQCKWMTRLWTMQEGILASELTFQFRNKTQTYVDMQKLLSETFKKTPEASHMPAAKANLVIASKLRFERPDDDRPCSRLRSLWFTVRHRTTSRSSDQAICAGILCRLNLSKILAASKEDKMRVFWQECNEVPLSILWTNGPRFKIDTMRWAAESLLDPRTWAVPPESTPHTAKVSLEGLCFSGVEAFALPNLKRPSSEDSMIAFKAPPLMNQYHLLLAKNVGNPSWDDLEDDWSNVALLWDQDSIHEFFAGILVSVICSNETDYVSQISKDKLGDSEGRQIKARWLAQVTILSDGDNWHEMVSQFPTRFSEDGNPINELLDVEVHSSDLHIIPKASHWCIL